MKPKPSKSNSCPRCQFGSLIAGRCMNCDDSERFAVNVHEKFAVARAKQAQDAGHPWREKDEVEGD